MERHENINFALREYRQVLRRAETRRGRNDEKNIINKIKNK